MARYFATLAKVSPNDRAEPPRRTIIPEAPVNDIGLVDASCAHQGVAIDEVQYLVAGQGPARTLYEQLQQPELLGQHLDLLILAGELAGGQVPSPRRMII